MVESNKARGEGGPVSFKNFWRRGRESATTFLALKELVGNITRWNLSGISAGPENVAIMVGSKQLLGNVGGSPPENYNPQSSLGLGATRMGQDSNFTHTHLFGFQTVSSALQWMKH